MKESESVLVGFWRAWGKGVVCLVAYLFSSSPQKGGRTLRGQASRLLGVIFQTAGIIGAIYGLLLMPFQSHRANAASPPSGDTVEDQALTLVEIVAMLGISLAAIVIWEGGKWVIKEMKTHNGTLIADTDIAVDSLNGETTIWYDGKGWSGEKNSWVMQYKYDEDYSTESQRKSHYEFWNIWVVYVQWDEDREYYVATDSRSFYGHNLYLPNCINDAYNYGNWGDEDTRNTGFVIESGTAEMNHLSHVFPKSTSGRQILIWKAVVSRTTQKYTPTFPICAMM